MATLSPIFGADWDVRVGALVVLLRHLLHSTFYVYMLTRWPAKNEG